MSLTASSTYLRLYDDFAEHPKVLRLSDRALRVHIAALCYSSRNATNGHIPKKALASFGGTPKHSAELTGLNIWEPGDGGWVIHDYLEYQRSKAQIDAEREAARKRMGQNRKRSGEVRANIERSSGEVRNPEVRVQSTEGSAAAGARSRDTDPSLAAVCTAYENEIGSLGVKVGGDIIDELDEGTPADWIVKAIGESARFNKRSWGYVQGILRRYNTEGPHDRPKPDDGGSAVARDWQERHGTT